MTQSPPAIDPLFLSFQLALAGKYSIDRELGRGGMGVVYLAREVHLDRLVAIKLLPPERAAEPGVRERFLREARLAAKLSHPNVIPIHAVEETGGYVYYVMAFVDGETLAHRVRTRGPLPNGDGTRMLREVAWALAYAHGQRIVHRDVKPDNILIEAATGRVLVADFGIAAVADDASGESTVAGTPEFMSPEQGVGGQVDGRSDIYALGATAFYAFSGRFPFEGSTATEIIAKHVTEPPPSLASIGVTVSRRLATLIDRCLAKDPAHRPASAQEVAEQLGLALEQRREIPAALRAFIKRQARLNGGWTLLAAIMLLPLSLLFSSMYGGIAGFGTLLLGLTAAPLAYFVVAARRLMLLGFRQGDLLPAFKAEVEQANEELAIERRVGPRWLERALLPVSAVSGAIFALDLVGLLATAPRGSRFETMMLVLGVAGGATFLSAIGLLSLRQRRRDVDTELWSKIWTGRIGKLAFSFARKLLGDRAPQSAPTHRATELSLGMAAEQLYEALPEATRQTLGDLPALLARLQGDAQLLRTRLDELQALLAGASDESASAEHARLRAARDTTHAKLGEAVAALETIRLDLLRLHAGSTTVEGFTTQLGHAAEISAQVQRLIAAQAEVERSVA